MRESRKEKRERVIEKYNSVKGMVIQVLRVREDARNSAEWCGHLVQKECAKEYYGKKLHELSKDERLSLPKRSTIARCMRDLQNDEGKYLPEREVQVDREVKRQAMHKNFSDAKKVMKNDFD